MNKAVIINLINQVHQAIGRDCYICNHGFCQVQIHHELYGQRNYAARQVHWCSYFYELIWLMQI